MKNIRWLLTIADGKPLLFSLAILLIACSTLSIVVVNRDKKIDKCDQEKAALQRKYEDKYDSLIVYYRIKEQQLNDKIEKSLQSLVDDYKRQLEEQKQLNQKINSTINKNKSIIKSRVKNL